MPGTLEDRLIVALDVGSLSDARRFVKLLKKEISLYKVGSILFTAGGPDVVRMIHDEGGRVFLDLKYHDIPNTVAKACEAAARLGVFMLDVHTSGNPEMMTAASEAVKSFGKKRPCLVGVTVLTSDQNNASVKKEVLKRTQTALESGLDGVVCSAWETAYLRKQIKRDFIIVNPGIRFSDTRQMGDRGRAATISPSNLAQDLASPVRAKDQKRVATPEAALSAGASFIVIGRPILESPDPRGVLRRIGSRFRNS